jgi:hypothetical protein
MNTVKIVEPFVFDDPTVLENGEGGFPFPDMTDQSLSEGWESTGKTWFVDSSGFGREDESALTAGTFRKQLIEYLQEHPDHGLGLSGIGQFQVYVSAYRKVDANELPDGVEAVCEHCGKPCDYDGEICLCECCNPMMI